MKKTTNSQLIGQRGEHAAAAQTLAMGFTFQGFNRLETGIDAFLELREPQTGTMLAKWIGAHETVRSATLVTAASAASRVRRVRRSQTASGHR